MNAQSLDVRLEPTSRAIVIATGAAPIVPDLPGLDRVRHVTSEDLWSVTEKPERLLVLGGEPIGCRVTQVARSGILPKEDDDTIVLIEAAALREDGVRLLTHTRTLRCEVVHEEQRLVVTSGPSAHPDQSSGGAEEALPFNLLLCAIGRRARVTGFGLEALGIPLTAAGTIETNAYLQTCYPKILACGDVVGPHQFTHVAAHQAWYAAVNVLGTIRPGARRPNTPPGTGNARMHRKQRWTGWRVFIPGDEDERTEPCPGSLAVMAEQRVRDSETARRRAAPAITRNTSGMRHSEAAPRTPTLNPF
ncbi:FAD-dependent oxidoreductase [Thiocapsa roseopersicina]|uniref:Pyridine nucleotide-disulphide oxidoreductase n=1 Tax=Thiocapsa roseopersicina TaxID=1058 RepID=A0A1H2VG42_THIRO|nr:FAD-dependent oxidoreductase [Thiocapsa roseopersicina]SDW67252.1 Pyridine nucleotide-disulphide oxidoreductase [Thiocapsa roseopersicina]